MPRISKLHTTILVLASLSLLIFPQSSLYAQDAGRIIDFFGQQLLNEWQRQQLQDQQRQQYQMQYQQLQRDWQACHSGDLHACDRGLASPILSPNDQQQLFAWRNNIVARQQIEREQAARQQREQQSFYRDFMACRNNNIDGCDRALRHPQIADTDRRTLEAWRSSAVSAREQSAHDERRRREVADYQTAVRGCGQYQMYACAAALNSTHLVHSDREQLFAQYKAAEKFIEDRDACKSGQVRSCNAALASPAGDPATRANLVSWRDAASPTQRILALLPTGSTSQRGADISVVILFGVAFAILSITAVWLYQASTASASAMPIPRRLVN